MTNPIEEGSELKLDFTKLNAAIRDCPGVIPVAVQDIDTQELLVVAYVNEIALKEAIKRRTAVFWSTSRNELWIKGETSGNTFDLIEIRVNCEQNSLLYRVRPRGSGMCHTRNQEGESRSGCYYRRLDFETEKLENLDP